MLDSPPIHDSSYARIYDKYLQPADDGLVDCTIDGLWMPSVATSDVRRRPRDRSPAVIIRHLVDDDDDDKKLSTISSGTTTSPRHNMSGGVVQMTCHVYSDDGIRQMSSQSCDGGGRTSPEIAERDVDSGSRTSSAQATEVTVARRPRYKRSFLDRVEDLLPPPPRRGFVSNQSVDTGWFSSATVAAAPKRDAAVDVRIDGSPETSIGLTASSSSLTTAGAGFRRMRTSLTRIAEAASGSRRGRRKVSFVHESKC